MQDRPALDDFERSKTSFFCSLLQKFKLLLMLHMYVQLKYCDQVIISFGYRK